MQRGRNRANVLFEVWGAPYSVNDYQSYQVYSKQLGAESSSSLSCTCTVNFGYNDIGYNDISLITTYISCPELFSIYCHTKSFGYNDILNNDTSQITTHISRLKALQHCEYNDNHSSVTVLASPLKKIAPHISRLMMRRHVTKHAPVKNMPA